MLASTSAGLVPPYLTIPLTNRVLVPFEAGIRPIIIYSRSIWPACSARPCWLGYWE